MKWLPIALLLLGFTIADSASAALKVGDHAPAFTADAAVGGKLFKFSLEDALRRGPVVLYFFPKAFTSGCTLEAHAFSDASASFTAAGATLIGMSSDKIATLSDFSSRECRAKFPVAADPDLSVIRAYDVVMVHVPGFGGLSNRTSYVIAPGNKILYVYTDLSPNNHVANTLAVVRAWQAQHKS